MKKLHELSQQEISDYALDLFNSGKTNETQSRLKHQEACSNLSIARKHKGNDRDYWIKLHENEAYLYKILKSLHNPILDCKEILKYVSAKYFFADYAKTVKNFTHKMRGTDGNGKPIGFTIDDKKAITDGLLQMAKDTASKLK